jgi:hypothetical protein
MIGPFIISAISNDTDVFRAFGAETRSFHTRYREVVLPT